MSDSDDELLNRMSSRELRELESRIHDAIRAHIRLKNAQKALAANPSPVGPALLPQVAQSQERSQAARARTGSTPAAALNGLSGAGEQPRVSEGAFDLERERDAWVARKRATGG